MFDPARWDWLQKATAICAIVGLGGMLFAMNYDDRMAMNAFDIFSKIWGIAGLLALVLLVRTVIRWRRQIPK